MGNSYGREIIKQAARLYIEDGKTFEQISESFKGNPSARTISRWAAKDNWDIERERLSGAPLRVDRAALQAMSMEIEALQSPSGSVRAEAIKNLHKLAVARNKIGTNRVDMIPIALKLGEHLVNLALRRIPQVTPAEHRLAVNAALTKIMQEWYREIITNPMGAVDA